MRKSRKWRLKGWCYIRISPEKLSVELGSASTENTNNLSEHSNMSIIREDSGICVTSYDDCDGQQL